MIPHITAVLHQYLSSLMRIYIQGYFSILITQAQWGGLTKKEKHGYIFSQSHKCQQNLVPHSDIVYSILEIFFHFSRGEFM